MTLASQIAKLKQRFHLDHVVLVGDRGMITQARITEDIKPAGLDWITALRVPAIKALLESGSLQLSLFDQRDMASITAPDFPGERLVVCRNPDLAAERSRNLSDLGVRAITPPLSPHQQRRSATAIHRLHVTQLDHWVTLAPGAKYNLDVSFTGKELGSISGVMQIDAVPIAGGRTQVFGWDVNGTVTPWHPHSDS
jgi:hypothetical protein